MAATSPQAAPGARDKKGSGSETRKRTRIVGFRATDAERAEMEAAATRAGLTVGSYVRARVLTAPTTRAVRQPTVERAMLAQLLGQLGKVGGNVHQITKKLNVGERVTHAELHAALADFREAAAVIMQALGKRSPRAGARGTP